MRHLHRLCMSRLRVRRLWIPHRCRSTLCRHHLVAHSQEHPWLRLHHPSPTRLHSTCRHRHHSHHRFGRVLRVWRANFEQTRSIHRDLRHCSRLRLCGQSHASDQHRHCVSRSTSVDHSAKPSESGRKCVYNIQFSILHSQFSIVNSQFPWSSGLHRHSNIATNRGASYRSSRCLYRSYYHPRWHNPSRQTYS